MRDASRGRRPPGRRQFLRLGRAAIALAALGAAGCGGRAEVPASQGPGSPTSIAPEVPPPGPTQPPADTTIATDRGPLRGILHPVAGARRAIVTVSGIDGGFYGPNGIYEPLARRMQAAGVAALRLDYRKPGELEDCIYDLLAALDDLADKGIERIVLVGWSFGGAVAISAGAARDSVVGVAAIASQTYGAQDVDRLSPRSLLLLHGTADDIIPPYASRELYDRAGDPKELVMYPDDGHFFRQHSAAMLDKLYEWGRAVLSTPASLIGEPIV